MWVNSSAVSDFSRILVVAIIANSTTSTVTVKTDVNLLVPLLFNFSNLLSSCKNNSLILECKSHALLTLDIDLIVKWLQFYRCKLGSHTFPRYISAQAIGLIGENVDFIL